MPIYTVTAQWAPPDRGVPGPTTEFEVYGDNIREATEEARRTLAEEYPAGGVVIALKAGSGLGLWDRLMQRQRQRFRELQAPPPKWWERFLPQEKETLGDLSKQTLDSGTVTR
jgi:hypothetical protein